MFRHSSERKFLFFFSLFCSSSRVIVLSSVRLINPLFSLNDDGSVFCISCHSSFLKDDSSVFCTSCHSYVLPQGCISCHSSVLKDDSSVFYTSCHSYVLPQGCMSCHSSVLPQGWKFCFLYVLSLLCSPSRVIVLFSVCLVTPLFSLNDDSSVFCTFYHSGYSSVFTTS